MDAGVADPAFRRRSFPAANLPRRPSHLHRNQRPEPLRRPVPRQQSAQRCEHGRHVHERPPGLHLRPFQLRRRRICLQRQTHPGRRLVRGTERHLPAAVFQPDPQPAHRRLDPGRQPRLLHRQGKRQRPGRRPGQQDRLRHALGQVRGQHLLRRPAETQRRRCLDARQRHQRRHPGQRQLQLQLRQRQGKILASAPRLQLRCRRRAGPDPDEPLHQRRQRAHRHGGRR
ncbi:hypothetical protein SRABI112_04124 [Pseudomonas mediterranea]|nr:hypothetical protein SRABI112_04124 [Pseudomonas mediterranea]